MGGHRWLLGPLICLLLATTSARPPECKEAPSWTINGEQPLAKTKGKASMLEALLNHFRSYGMNDLEFIIVNSKLSHAQDKLQELQKLVSFEVYQETDEEEVWSVMEGGKDDMYVYDRCGRLTYFIPFPLSILNESPLVSNAILDTYYRNPCGEKCDQNRSLDDNEIVNNIENNFEESNTTEQEQDNAVYVITEDYVPDNETNDNEINETSLLNDLIAVIDNKIDAIYLNDSNNQSDIANSTLNVTSQLIETNNTSIDKAKTFFSYVYRVFFHPENNNETTVDTNTNETAENIPNNSTEAPKESVKDLHHKHHSHHQHGHKGRNHQGKNKSNRCLEADYEVCKDWSKNRLLIAQKCCSETRIESDLSFTRSCQHFGKKRCKKIQSILKCCIKTVYTEPSTTLATTTTEESSKESAELSGIACCKTTEEGKICRMSTSGDCDEDEEKDSFQTK